MWPQFKLTGLVPVGEGTADSSGIHSLRLTIKSSDRDDLRDSDCLYARMGKVPRRKDTATVDARYISSWDPGKRR